METKTLSIVIPAYNEEKRLPGTLDEIETYFSSVRDYEVIVVDDGSSDNTPGYVNERRQSFPQLRVVQLERNFGKGKAVKTGMLQAEGKHILYLDADGATPIAEYERLENAIKSDFDIVIGSRALQTKDTKVNTVIHRKILGRIFNSIVNILLVPGIADTQCGFKLFTKESARKIFSEVSLDGFAFDVEVLYLARKHKLRICEVAINWNNISGTKVRVGIDSFLMLKDLLLLRFK